MLSGGREGSGERTKGQELPSVPLDASDSTLRQSLLSRATLRESVGGTKALLDETRTSLERKAAAEASSTQTQEAPALQADAAVEKTEPETQLITLLKERMRMGPMPVSEYMQIAMQHPEYGYYTSKGFTGIFGQRGDFTTAPEISQIFGEIVAIWVVWVWQTLGSPKRVQLIELGPGRGTMMTDMLRAWARFRPFLDVLSVHMVDSSEELQEIQRKRLSTGSKKGERTAKHDGTGVTVHWHKALRDVPVAKGASSIIIGQEFLDCMPVRQFVNTEKGWCEKMVHLAPPDSPHHFAFVLSPGPTAAAKICLRKDLVSDLPDKPKHLEGIEVSPEAWYAAQEIARRVHATDGAALLIDYGNNGSATDTLQALRDHKPVHPLSSPGRADLTAHVDFASVKRASLDWCPNVAAMVANDLRGIRKALRQGPEQQQSTTSTSAQVAAAGAADAASGQREGGGEGLVGGGLEGVGLEAAKGRRGLVAHGPVTQCEFLHGLGVRERAEKLFHAAGEDEAKQAIVKQYERLTAPQEMGELFKVLAITCDKIPPGTMPGFAVAAPDAR
jgi:NADH dehydrogenase [ubiquinone] 1 alpha subcomplex assembly factor 7